MGVWLSAGTLAVFWWHWGGESDNLGMARTAAVTTMVLFQKVHVFNCRSEYLSMFAKSPLANLVLFLGVLTSLAVHVAAVYLPFTQRLLRFEPLDLATWAVAAAVALTAIPVNELHKRLRTSQSGGAGEPVPAASRSDGR